MGEGTAHPCRVQPTPGTTIHALRLSPMCTLYLELKRAEGSMSEHV